MKSVFSRIIDGEILAERMYEDEEVIAIKDIAPVAPVHILIIPKKVIKDIQSLKPEDFGLLSKVVLVSQKLARELNIEDGYRIVTNNGARAGQTVFHLHFHLIAGKELGSLA